jgi:plastocyanin
MLPLFTPTGQNVANSVDAAGAPFWFNGQPGLTFNPAFGKSSFGKKLTYTGAKRIESGLPPDKPKPLTVKFTKAGSFDIYCDIHPGMKGTVVVRKKGAAVPTAAQDSKAVKKQTAAAIAGAKGLATQSQPANTVSLGVAGKGGLEYFGMVPATLTVKTGTTVKFQMSPGSYEGHTATFGPGNPETEPASYLGQVTAGFERGDPRAIYPSNPPGAPFALTTTSHGNGFWNSGVLDAAAASPLPSSASVQFGAPGTYTYYCLIHPFMKGTVVVQ